MRIVFALGMILTVTACGSVDGTSPSGSASAQLPASTGTYVEDPTLAPTSKQGPRITVRGTVADGVEAGCLTITDTQGTWTLVGQTAGIKAGDTVTVRGTVREDLATTCQQGTALWVDEVVKD